MTDTEFENAKGIVFDNIVRLTNLLRRPPAYDEFLAAAAKVKQALPHLGWDVSAADFDKILRAVRVGLTVQMEDDEAVIEDAAAINFSRLRKFSSHAGNFSMSRRKTGCWSLIS